MNKYLIGMDIGTSGTKSVLFDLEGNTVASCTEEYHHHVERAVYQGRTGAYGNK